MVGKRKIIDGVTDIKILGGDTIYLRSKNVDGIIIVDMLSGKEIEYKGEFIVNENIPSHIGLEGCQCYKVATLGCNVRGYDNFVKELEEQNNAVKDDSFILETALRMKSRLEDNMNKANETLESDNNYDMRGM